MIELPAAADFAGVGAGVVDVAGGVAALVGVAVPDGGRAAAGVDDAGVDADVDAGVCACASLNQGTLQSSAP